MAAEVRLMRQIHKGAIVLIEGETDAKIIDKLVDGDAVETEVSFCKSNALVALDLLEDEGFPGVLAIVDADFDRIVAVDRGLEHLFLCDHHDLELMMFGSEALDAYLREHATEQLFKGNFKNDIAAVREKMFSTLAPLALCRLVNYRMGWRLDFKSVRLDNYVDATSLEMDVDALFCALLNGKPSPCSLQQLKGRIAQEESKAWDVWDVSNGHDVCTILGVALRACLASRKVAQTWGSEIEAGLRLAYDKPAFEKTTLFADLRDWEKRNPRYQLFRCRDELYAL